MSKSPLLLLPLACGLVVSPLATSLAGTSSTAPWVKMGGLPGADIGRIVFDPNNPNTMLAGAQAGGGELYRSTNGGTTFTRIQVGTIYEAFRVIAFDPKKTSGIAFAASSDFSTGQNAAVYESTNGGVSWSRLQNQPVSGSLGRARGIAIDPTGSLLTIADSRHGIFYSSNLGSSWTQSLSNASTGALAADPKQANTLWAGGYDLTTPNGTSVLWKSTNFGKSWTEVTVPVLNQDYFPLPIAITILPNSSTILFAWTGNDSSGNLVGGVIASKDGGKTWVNSSKGLPTDFDPGNAIVVDPTTPNTLYLTTNGMNYPNGLYRSTDGGATWTAVGNATGGGDGVFTAVARPAAAGVLAAVFGADEDLIESTNHGASWTVSANGTNNGVLTEIQDDLLATGGIYAGTSNGFFHSTNNGQSWARISSSWTGATVPRAFAVDPVAKTHTVYAATQTTFWQSSNAGKTWTASALPSKASTITQLIADKSVSGRIYAVDSTRSVYRSDNGGKSWNTGVGIGAAADHFALTPAVLPDPTQASLLYAGMADGLWKSANSDGSWSKLSSLSGFLALTAIAQKSGTEIFAEVQQSSPTSGLSFVMKKSIGGASFSTVTSPYPNAYFPLSLAAAPNNTAIYAFNVDNSVMRSTDNASSWSVVDGPIESSIVSSSALSLTANNIYVGDYATNSVFTAPLAALTTGAPTASPRISQAKGSAVRAGQMARHIAE